MGKISRKFELETRIMK